MRTTNTLLILAFALLAAPAFGQEQLPARETGAQRAARLYRAADWPAPSGALTGVDLAGVQAQGFGRLSLRIDPLKASAEARFARREQEQQQQLGPVEQARAPRAEVLVRIRVLADPTRARQDLVGSLAATQIMLERRRDLPGVAFSAGAKGGASLVVGARGNVRYDVRALCDVDVQPLAVALAQVISAAPVAEEGWVPTPVVEACSAGNARAGAPAKLALRFSQSAPQPVEVAFRCSPGASVLKTKTGYELYASKAGTVTVEVFAASKGLGVSRSVHTVEVSE